MAGELVPLVMIPRFTTYAGVGTYSTIAMEVTEYQSAILNVWRGPAVGTWGIRFEESTDGVGWADCTVTPSGTPPYDPTENTEIQYVATLRKRWFRVSAVLAGTNPVATCWAVGFLEQRER
jgi:hypothetical protein